MGGGPRVASIEWPQRSQRELQFYFSFSLIAHGKMSRKVSVPLLLSYKIFPVWIFPKRANSVQNAYLFNLKNWKFEWSKGLYCIVLNFILLLTISLTRISLISSYLASKSPFTWTKLGKVLKKTHLWLKVCRTEITFWSTQCLLASSCIFAQAEQFYLNEVVILIGHFVSDVHKFQRHHSQASVSSCDGFSS